MRSSARTRILICAIVVLGATMPEVPAVLAAAAMHAHPAATPIAATGALLIENVGQLDPRARYQLLGGGGVLWLAEDALWISALSIAADGATHQAPSAPIGGAHVRLSFPGANPSPHLEPFGRLGTRVSYFRGSDPAGWYADVPVWQGVRYLNLYPGLDLEVIAVEGSWSWRLVPRTAEGRELLAAASSTDVIRLRIEGADAAATHPAAVVVDTAAGMMVLPLLGGDVAADVSPEVEPDGGGTLQITFPFAGAAPHATATSPVLGTGHADLLYSSFLGGSGVDTGRDVTVDAAGYAHVTGETWSIDFPVTPGAFDTTASSPDLDADAFVAKLAPDGRTLVYATFVGGSGHDNSYAIAVDAAGNAYITGETQSADFATPPGAFDTTYSTVGWSDAFVAKLNATGSALSYATYLGGSDTDIGYGIAVDGGGNAYVVGYTGYSDPGMEDYQPFPTTPGAFDETHNGTTGDTDAFVAKLSASGSTLAYGTLYGAGDRDEAYDVAVDAAGCAFITGMTQSPGLPATAGAFATTHGGDDDAFVAKFTADGSGLAYAAFLGAADSDWGYGIAVDNVGCAYVTGFTGSATFPVTPGAFDVTHNGEYDAFVTRVSPDGASLSYSTFLGGTSADKGRTVAVDRYWCAYVAGETHSSDMAVTPGAFDTGANGHKDAFVAKLNTAGAGLAYGTYLGGSDEDVAHGIAVAESGHAVVTGETASYTFPVTAGAADIGFNFGGRDAWVSHLAMAGGEQPTATPTPTLSPTPTAAASPTATVTAAPPSSTPTAPATATAMTPSATPTAGPSPTPAATTTTAPPSATPISTAPPTPVATGTATPTADGGGGPDPADTPSPPNFTPTAEPDGDPDASPTTTATPLASPTLDPRLWARCFLPLVRRP